MADKVKNQVKAHVDDKVKHVAAPWLLCASTMPVALATHAAWGHDGTMQAFTGAGAMALTMGVHHTWARRHEHTRLIATVVAGATTGWTALATAAGPLSHGMLNAWAFGGVVLSLMWNLRGFAHAAPHETDVATGSTDSLLEKIGGAVAGARVKAVRTKPGRLEADVQLKPGETADGVRQESARIASLAKVGTEQVTVTDVRGRADKVVLAFQDNPEQRQAVRGYTPGQLGRSVADGPMVFGQRADGEPVGLWIVGDEDMDNPRPLGHTLTTGMTGSGKTETVKTLVIRIRETRDCVPVAADPAKFSQSFGEIADAFEIAAKGVGQTNRLIRNLPSVITYRAELLGSLVRSDGTTGYSQWVPECWTVHGIPAVFVDIEEATDVLSTVDDEFDDAVRKARSVGIHLNASMQTAPYDNMARKTRGQLANSLCHGCSEDADAKFSLTSGTREAGADPTKWQNNYPGSLYAELVGVPREQWSTEARAYGLTRAEKRALLNESRPTWAHLDAGTKLRLGAGIVMTDEQVTAPLPAIVLDPAAEPEQDVPGTLDLTQVVTEEGVTDVTQPIPAPTGASITLVPEPAYRMDTEDAYRLLKNRIDTLERDGRETVAYKDLTDLPQVTGLSRTTIYNLLKRLEENGRLVSEVGKGRPPYRIRARVLNGHDLNR